MQSRLQKPQPQKLLCSIREVAHMLGLSRSTVRRYLDSGILTDVRVGKLRKFRVADVIKFAENGLSLERLRRVRAAVNAQQGDSSSDSV